MHKLIALIFFLTLTAYSDSVKPKAEYGFVHGTMDSLKRLKIILQARVIGLELYSPLLLPEITEDDSRDSARKKLKEAGFALIERDQVVNVIDAKERPTGQRAYPLSQRINLASGKYNIEDLCLAIKKQLNFQIETGGIFRHWSIVEINFQKDTVLSVRELLNLVAEKNNDFWIVERSSFMMNMSIKTGEFTRTDHPVLAEDDSGDLTLLK